jgi:uncharacterized protein (TIGR00255 family)
MTGYGEARGDCLGQTATVEIRSVNGRYRETIARLPQNLTVLEEPLKKILATQIHRGRVELKVQLSQGEDLTGFGFNAARAEAALNLLTKLKDETGVEGPITLDHLLALKVLDESSASSLDLDKAKPIIENLTVLALNQMVDFRAKEGQALEEELLNRISLMEAGLERIKVLAQDAAATVFARLKAKINELIQERLDPDRLAQEAAFLAERVDITEEIVRFGGHLVAFRRILGENGPIGRRLEFALQELLREANTMGAKSPTGALTDEVLALKSEMEKAREQALNIE